jgi:hypothetical protein
VQQAAGPVAGTTGPGGVTISDPDDAFERAAVQAAGIALGRAATAGPPAAGTEGPARGVLAIQRDGPAPAPGPTAEPQSGGGDQSQNVPAGDLSAAETETLENAQRLAAEAGKNTAAAKGALSEYAAGAPGAFADLKATFDGAVKLYNAASEKMNFKIKKVKEAAEVRSQILGMLFDSAFGAVAGKIGELIDPFKNAQVQLQSAWEGFPPGALQKVGGGG